jgi:hypothetical protein
MTDGGRGEQDRFRNLRRPDLNSPCCRGRTSSEAKTLPPRFNEQLCSVVLDGGTQMITKGHK